MGNDTLDAFQKLETKQYYLKTKKIRPEIAEEWGPHPIRLEKGASPEYTKLTGYQQFCWKTMGNFVRSHKKLNVELEEDLLKAHMKIRPEEYVACAWMSTLLSVIVSAIIALVFGIFISEMLHFSFLMRIITSCLIFVIIPIVAYIIHMGMPILWKGIPASKGKSRARDIDARMTGAMSFISAMASANVPVDVIFKELSREKVYGEIQEEAKWITRDTELLGVDILTAIRKASKRSPSLKFQDFLQGVVTTSTSGGELKPYFLMKAEEYEKEDKLEMRKKMETLGMLAESFVTVVVAFPLFLVVILAIMAIVGGSAGATMMLLYAVVGVMIPMSQFMFIFVVWNMSQEV